MIKANIWYERFTGTVADTMHRSETHLSGGGGYSGYVAPIKSTNVTTDKICLVGEQGEEKHLNVPADFSVRVGNKVTVIWGNRKGTTSGPYVAFYNHNTKQKMIRRNSVVDILAGGWKMNLYSWALFLGGWLPGAFVGSLIWDAPVIGGIVSWVLIYSYGIHDSKKRTDGLCNFLSGAVEEPTAT